MNELPSFELAAALFSLLGEPIPHDPSADAEAGVLHEQLQDENSALRKVLELCGTPQIPAQFYLCTKLYSWLGLEYDELTIQCAKAYLASSGWEAIERGIVEDRGVTIDRSSSVRAGILADLARAYAGERKYEKACAAYLRAYEAEPSNANYAIEVSNTLVLSDKFGEALEFLIRQKKSPYCRAVKYRDQSGQVHLNSDFRDLLERQTICLQNRLKRQGK